MRIKVVTSINVRSSPYTSPSSAIQVAFSESERRDAAVLKKSHPATPSSSSSSSGQLPRMDRLIASQRIPHGSRLSGWLHGSSVRSKDTKKPPIHPRKPKTSHTSTYCFAGAGRGDEQHAPGIRSYPSTRGVIDPVHSPTYGPGQLAHGPDPRHLAYLERLRAELGSVPREHRSKKNSLQKPKRARARPERFCFPQIKDLKLRRKMMGCFFFGTLLTILLTTCTSCHAGPGTMPSTRQNKSANEPADLALAISESLHGATFHGVFIFFILLLTIFFCHYLIRLCMLAFEPRPRFARGKTCPTSPLHPDTGFAQPSHPIPVVFARDEELGLHDNIDNNNNNNNNNRRSRVEEELQDDDDADSILPPPPPAYGLWRSSVV